MYRLIVSFYTMKAIIDKLNPGSIIEIPNEDQIIVIEVPNIGYCISVKYRNMMTWIEIQALYQAINIVDDCDTYQERLNELLGKTIYITKRIAEDFHPISRDIE